MEHFKNVARYRIEYVIYNLTIHSNIFEILFLTFASFIHSSDKMPAIDMAVYYAGVREDAALNDSCLCDLSGRSPFSGGGCMM